MISVQGFLGALPASQGPIKNGFGQPDTSSGQSQGQGGLQALFAHLIGALEDAVEEGVAGQGLPLQAAAQADEPDLGRAPTAALEEFINHLPEDALEDPEVLKALQALEALREETLKTSEPDQGAPTVDAAGLPIMPAVVAPVVEGDQAVASKVERKGMATQGANLHLQTFSQQARPEAEVGRLLNEGPRASQTLNILPPVGSESSKDNLSALLASQRPASTHSLPAGLELRLDGAPTAVRAGAAEWAAVKVDTQHGQWSRDLMAALGDRLTMQLNQNVKEATVRLDPPELGRIELVVRMDGDRLNVQLNASNVGVRDMLTQHAERLRAELMEQNLQTVDVQVGEHSQRDNSDRYQPQAETIASNSLAPASEPEQESAEETHNGRWLSTRA